jgi:hypothetical protein
MEIKTTKRELQQVYGLTRSEAVKLQGVSREYDSEDSLRSAVLALKSQRKKKAGVLGMVTGEKK